jgi:hypothetical protein
VALLVGRGLEVYTATPYTWSVHAVIETPAYLSAADDAGMKDSEREEIVKTIAEKPTIGDVIPETGGCRKIRVAGRGKGKSGGYRVITYYGGEDAPVFLLTVFSKGERDNLAKGERNALKKLTETLVESLGRKVEKKRKS